MNWNPWPRLGAYIYTGESISDVHFARFSGEAGGSWVVPVLAGDDVAGPWNLANLDALKAFAAPHGVRVGGWFNGSGGDPQADAQSVAAVVEEHRLPLAVLDLEAAYQYPGGDADLMPALLRALRVRLPQPFPIGVTTTALTDSMIWNGRTLTPRQSFYDLGVRALPQWYSGYYDKDGNLAPTSQMRWLHLNGSTDSNFADSTAPSGRGLPLSYVHAAWEVTGLEGSDLARELVDTNDAKRYGYSKGGQIYTLENAAEGDWPILAGWRGRLWQLP